MILIPIDLNHAVLLTPAHTGITPYRFCTGPAVPDIMARRLGRPGAGAQAFARASVMAGGTVPSHHVGLAVPSVVRPSRWT